MGIFALVESANLRKLDSTKLLLPWPVSNGYYVTLFLCSINCKRKGFTKIYFASERSERDTLSRSPMKNAIRIYIYRYMRHTLVAQSWGYVMWEEISVSHI